MVAIERRSSFQSFLRLVVRELLFSGIEHVLFLKIFSLQLVFGENHRQNQDRHCQNLKLLSFSFFAI